MFLDDIGHGFPQGRQADNDRQLPRQHFPEVANDLVTTKLAQGPVEIRVGARESVRILAGAHQFQLIDVPVQNLNGLTIVMTSNDGTDGCGRLKCDTRLDEVVDALLRNVPQANALVGLVHDKTLALQDAEGLPDRHATDAETLCKIGFHDAVAGQDAA